MSRIAKAPVNLPKGVTATVSPEAVIIKGAKGTLSTPLSRGVTVVQADQHLEVKYVDPGLSRMQAGATRAHLANMVTGVTKGYEKKLEIVGVGYLAAIQKNKLQLRVGFANEIHLEIPTGLNVTVPDKASEVNARSISCISSGSAVLVLAIT